MDVSGRRLGDGVGLTSGHAIEGQNVADQVGATDSPRISHQTTEQMVLPKSGEPRYCETNQKCLSG